VGVQLELPLGDVGPPRPAPIPPARRVYVNRDLKMAQVAWIGFDMDYTLAIYRQEEMDRLSVQATVDKLVRRGYPDWLPALRYPLDFPIRGLLVDKRLGNVLKMNRFKIVRRGYHGLRELGADELRALYYDKKIRHKTPRYHWIDTLYALSEACVYAAIVEEHEQRRIPVDYGRLFKDIRECIDEAHRDGSILDAVMADKDRYVERDASLAHALHRLRSAGKRLFLLTNSRAEYTRAMMGHMLDGVLSDYPSYEHYFDAVIVAAQKPSFFQQRRPLMERTPSGLVPASAPLERGRVYEGGNLHDLGAALGVAGDAVLYVGDHIYGDILRSKKDSSWRTAMIIQELEAEVGAHLACGRERARYGALYDRRLELDDDLRRYQQLFKEVKRHEDGNGASEGREQARIKQILGAIRRELRLIEAETAELRARIDKRFHPYWGPLLKEANELSLFGHQVSEYACLYTSRVSNLLAYSPQQYFRTPRDLMHHEL
jgi:HAD superfamily 5'-nucleotidase-like hydrolase